MHADVRYDGHGSRKEEIVERGEMTVSVGAKISVCEDELGERDVYVITHEAWLTVRGGK